MYMSTKRDEIWFFLSLFNTFDNKKSQDPPKKGYIRADNVLTVNTFTEILSGFLCTCQKACVNVVKKLVPDSFDVPLVGVRPTIRRKSKRRITRKLP